MWKKTWRRKKLLVTSNFSFFHKVFKRLIPSWLLKLRISWRNELNNAITSVWVGMDNLSASRCDLLEIVSLFWSTCHYFLEVNVIFSFFPQGFQKAIPSWLLKLRIMWRNELNNAITSVWAGVDNLSGSRCDLLQIVSLFWSTCHYFLEVNVIWKHSYLANMSISLTARTVW